MAWKTVKGGCFMIVITLLEVTSVLSIILLIIKVDAYRIQLISKVWVPAI